MRSSGLCHQILRDPSWALSGTAYQVTGYMFRAVLHAAPPDCEKGGVFSKIVFICLKWVTSWPIAPWGKEIPYVPFLVLSISRTWMTNSCEKEKKRINPMKSYKTWFQGFSWHKHFYFGRYVKNIFLTRDTWKGDKVHEVLEEIQQCTLNRL